MNIRYLLILLLAAQCFVTRGQGVADVGTRFKLTGRLWREVRVCDVTRDSCVDGETFYDFDTTGYLGKGFKQDTTRFNFSFHEWFYVDDIFTGDTVLRVNMCNPMLSSYGALEDGAYLMRFLGEAGVWFMVLRFTGPDSLVWEGTRPYDDFRFKRIYWEVASKPLAARK